MKRLLLDLAYLWVLYNVSWPCCCESFFLVPFLCSARLGWIGRPCPNLFISHIQHTYFTPFFITFSAVNESHFSDGRFRELLIVSLFVRSRRSGLNLTTCVCLPNTTIAFHLVHNFLYCYSCSQCSKEAFTKYFFFFFLHLEKWLEIFIFIL